MVRKGKWSERGSGSVYGLKVGEGVLDREKIRSVGSERGKL